MLDQSSISSSRSGTQAGSVEELHAPILVPAADANAFGITIGIALGSLLGMLGGRLSCLLRGLLLGVSRDLGAVR
jgi:hypothetical protein